MTTADQRKIKTFGWSPTRLADLPMEDLLELQRRVDAEHANPRDENGIYHENGRPTLHLLDKKGMWKADKLSWAITYKLADARAAKKA